VAHEEIRSEKVFKNPIAPFSLATRTTGGTLLHVSGQVAQGSDGHTVGQGDIERQTTQVLENIKALVEAAGGTLAHVARIVVYLTTRKHLPAVMNVRRRYFREPYPASTAVVVVGLANAEWLVEIEATVVLP
jgi:enamine deaminase RidA (YjgF/YER057c/UK114 family)